VTSGHHYPNNVSTSIAPNIDSVVIVGASLAGLTAAEALRDEGFTGHLTLIGDETHEPYDRPPLSKSVLTGWLPVEHTTLPQLREINAEWLLGVAATGLDRRNHQVRLANRRLVDFDRLLIATGTRARPWVNPEQAALDGVFTVHTREDSSRLRTRLASRPKRVLVIGAGFTGSEVASVCRELGLQVTVAERGPTPLVGALGEAAGTIAALWQREYGVDLRCNVTVMALEGDKDGRLRRARLSDGDVLDVDVAVVALGAIRNIEWLHGANLAADGRGVVCDASCRAFDADGMLTDDIFVAGDVARWPNAFYDGMLLSVEHWGNAVEQAKVAAHNMVCAPSDRRAHKYLPTFWSNQFGVNIKSVGLPTIADEVVLTQGTVGERRFAAAYGKNGRMVAAVTVNAPRLLPAYRALIEAGAPFPPQLHASDGPAEMRPVAAGFRPPGYATHSPSAESTGPGPTTPSPERPMKKEGKASVMAEDPRIPPGPPPLRE
jgi:3-phenylpropionate/trans-cinnamate dioxygenase ferredoxin reductase component